MVRKRGTGGYKVTITLKKGLINLVLAMISGGIVYLANLPPEQQIAGWGIILAIMKMAENYLKHYKD